MDHAAIVEVISGGHHLSHSLYGCRARSMGWGVVGMDVLLFVLRDVTMPDLKCVLVSHDFYASVSVDL